QVVVADASANPIGQAFGLHNSTVASWAPFTYTINYSAPTTPASSTLVSFFLSSTVATTDAYLDDLALTYVVGVDEIHTVQLLGTSLNYDAQGGNYFLNVDVLSVSSFNVEVYDVMGKKVSLQNYSLQSGHHEIPVSAANLHEGVYLCRVKGAGVDKSFKFRK